MMPRLIAPLAASALAFALTTGCAPAEPEAGPADADASAPPAAGEAPAADAAEAEADAALTDEQVEAVRQLPEADAELALVQKVCPVSDEPLGSMGVPIKVDAKGVAVFVCCAGCEDSVKEDPDAYLAKVPQGGPQLDGTGPVRGGEGS